MSDEREAPCVHAVDGPDWAGLRELNNAEVDYKALVKQARGFVPIMESGNLILALADAVEVWPAIEQRLTDHIVQLAAERDALQARAVHAELEWSEAAAQRDILQARLDAMIVEWANWIETASAHVPGVTVEQVVDALRSGRQQPWGTSGQAVVPEGDANV